MLFWRVGAVLGGQALGLTLLERGIDSGRGFMIVGIAAKHHLVTFRYL